MVKQTYYSVFFLMLMLKNFIKKMSATNEVGSVYSDQIFLFNTCIAPI